MAILGPLGPPVGYGPAKFGARFNRQLSSIPHVCVRSLHVPSPLRFFKAHSKKCYTISNLDKLWRSTTLIYVNNRQYYTVSRVGCLIRGVRLSCYSGVPNS